MKTGALTILVYGASKSGKSTLAATVPAPRLILDVESSTRFLPVLDVDWDPKDPPPDASKHWDTAIVSVRDWATAKAVYAWLHSGKHPFKSIVVDSVSELQQRYVESIAGRGQPTQAQWGSIFREVCGFLRDLRDLTMHPTNPLTAVSLTAMAKQVDGVWKPWVQGQSQTVLPYLFDVTGYIWTESNGDGEQRKLLTRRTAQFEAGERVQGKIPALITIPNHPDGELGNDIERWIGRIFGTVEPATKAKPTPKPTPSESESQT
jgi:hypothetical protein